MARNRASRRKFLAGVLGASAVGLSGCGSDGDGTDTSGDADGTDSPAETQTATPTDAAVPTATADPTASPTGTPTATAEATATPGASSFADWPAFMRNNEHWGHHPDARGPRESVSVDWSREFDQDQVNATAVLADGTLYVGAGGAGDDDGSFHALDPVTGETKWSKDTAAPVTSAAAIDGLAYVGTTNGVLYALQTADGSEFWNYDLTSTEDFTAPVVADGDVYVGSSSSRTYRFDALDSTLKWDHSSFGAITASPVFADGMVYTPSRDQSLYAISTGGSVEWSKAFGGSVNGVSHRARRLHVATENRGVVQLNTRGSRIWRSSAGGAVASTPAVTENRVFAGRRDGILFAFNVDDGVEEWRFTEPANGVTAPPVVVNGTVYVGSRDGNVYAVDAETGDGLWTFETSNNIAKPAPVVAGGRVYIGSQDGTFYALSE